MPRQLSKQEIQEAHRKWDAWKSQQPARPASPAMINHFVRAFNFKHGHPVKQTHKFPK